MTFFLDWIPEAFGDQLSELREKSLLLCTYWVMKWKAFVWLQTNICRKWWHFLVLVEDGTSSWSVLVHRFFPTLIEDPFSSSWFFLSSDDAGKSHNTCCLTYFLVLFWDYDKLILIVILWGPSEFFFLFTFSFSCLYGGHILRYNRRSQSEPLLVMVMKLKMMMKMTSKTSCG